MAETDVRFDGRTLRVHDSGPTDGFPVFWHHGTPGSGATPPPLLHEGIRLVSHDRPGYGGSTRHEGRSVGSVAGDVAAIADELGIERFGVLGASGGGPHALACAALLPERVLGVVCLATLAPFDADGLDWFAGMCQAAEAETRASVDGPDALRTHLASAEFDPEIFTPADHATLAGPWAWLGADAAEGWRGGQDGMVDDDIALVTPWGCTPARITVPLRLLHGEQDRMVPVAHARWLARECPHATLTTFPGDGHVSVLTHTAAALDWLGELGSR
jgi:pimeloyl-ACP methyl ester carboxylesterase